MASLTVERLREDLEPFQRELMEEFYQNYAGLKDDIATVRIYEKYAHLFSEDAVALTRASAEAGRGTEDGRWLRYLREFATFGYVDSAVKQLSDGANTFETQSVIDCDGEKIPYRYIATKIRNEPSHEKRKKLFEGKLLETQKLNAILLERMGTAHDIAPVLGFKNYRDMCSSLKGIDYIAFEDQIEEMLRRTEMLYLDSMDDLLQKRAETSLSEAWSYDIPYAFRGEEFDGIFAKDKLVDAFFKTLDGMGLEPRRSKNIKIDMEERPKKSPRAFCAPVSVPQDVRLVIMPSGGWRDYDAFFHEGGHAWHFGHTKKEHPAEFRYLGDNSVTESFAFLFNYLPSNRHWLSKVLGMSDADEYIRFTLVNKLMFLRRYAAKLIYEMKLHNARVSSEFGEIYRSCLQKALKFRHTELHYLEDVDDAFYCAGYLRAWILEGQTRGALEEEFGEDWFQEEKAGKYLKELWSYGQKYTADELVKTIGYADLDIEPMLGEIERGLRE
ncbi:MAG: hypothetical protein A3K60_02055 [Euryarchaeota archaeon RBG_19FT_COMBO_56_21]|nr:MAG: hypothetical protein A3K60_02055 [Euryarchaeota archaeon RBG_19FT_COMBO_56_21]